MSPAAKRPASEGRGATSRRVGPPAAFLERAAGAGQAAARQSYLSQVQDREDDPDTNTGPEVPTGHSPGASAAKVDFASTQAREESGAAVPAPHVQTQEAPQHPAADRSEPSAQAPDGALQDGVGPAAQQEPIIGPLASPPAAELAPSDVSSAAAPSPAAAQVTAPEESPPSSQPPLAEAAALPAPPASLPARMGSRAPSRSLDSLGGVNPRRIQELDGLPQAYQSLLQSYTAAKLKRVKTTGRPIRLHPRIRQQLNEQLALDHERVPWKLASSHYVDAGLHVLTNVDVKSPEVLDRLLNMAFQFEEQTFGDEAGESTRFTLRPDTNQAIDKVKYALIANAQAGMLNHVLSILVWQYLLNLRGEEGDQP